MDDSTGSAPGSALASQVSFPVYKSPRESVTAGVSSNFRGRTVVLKCHKGFLLRFLKVTMAEETKNIYLNVDEPSVNLSR